MTAKEVIKQSLDLAHSITEAYLSDLSDAELLVRPTDGANHIAWQLGHLIGSEHMMMSAIGVDMPALPDGLVEAHSKESCTCDDASKFLTKQQYLELMGTLHTATKAAIDKADDASLDQPGPESMRSYAPTVGAAFNMIGSHELMHVGQFAAVRRKLGKPVVI